MQAMAHVEDRPRAIVVEAFVEAIRVLQATAEGDLQEPRWHGASQQRGQLRCHEITGAFRLLVRSNMLIGFQKRKK